MRRRHFITLLGGAAAWPLEARAQQAAQLRRVGVLSDWDENDPESKSSFSALIQELRQLGWNDGGNLKLDVRWSSGSIERIQAFAKELVSLQPDLIFSSSTPATAAVKRETRTIPIVFVVVADPIGPGFAASLARPGGNLTGFTNVEASMAGTWLELLTEIAPGVQRAAIMFNPDTAPNGGSYFLPPFEAAARSFKIDPIVAPVRSDQEIEHVITSLAGNRLSRSAHHRAAFHIMSRLLAQRHSQTT